MQFLAALQSLPLGRAMAKAAKSSVQSAVDFLAKPAAHTNASVFTVSGEDAYLRSKVLAALRQLLLGAGEADFSLTTLTGRDAQFRDLVDALASVSLFGDGRRLVVVEEADSFVSEYRPQLEDYVARPFQNGVLILDVKTWPANTRLAKAVAAHGVTIECKPPNVRQTKTWLVQRAKSEHDVKLEAAAVETLVELLPPELGVLEQEVAKLALLVGDNRTVDAKLVRDNVGGWRTRTTWEMIDAIADGQATVAIAQLDRLIASGEKPHGILPQMSSSLRRFSVAVGQIEAAEADHRRLPLREALAQAGVLPFKLGDAERQLRRIGRARAKKWQTGC